MSPPPALRKQTTATSCPHSTIRRALFFVECHSPPRAPCQRQSRMKRPGCRVSP